MDLVLHRVWPIGASARTRRTTCGLDKKLSEAHSLTGELINTRGWRTSQLCATVWAQIAITDVIGQNEYDVWLPLLCDC